MRYPETSKSVNCVSKHNIAIAISCKYCNLDKLVGWILKLQNQLNFYEVFSIFEIIIT